MKNVLVMASKKRSQTSQQKTQAHNQQVTSTEDDAPPPREILMTKTYRKNLKKILNQSPKIKNEIDAFLVYLKYRKDIPIKYKAHPMVGDRKGIWDAHIRGDLVLLYKFTDDEIILLELGSHSQLGI